MVSDKVNFEWAFDENHYKSCFARSVAVNSQFKQTKSPEDDPQEQHRQLHLFTSSSPLLLHPQKNNPTREKVGSAVGSTSSRPLVPESETVKLRKNSRGNMEADHRRASSCMSSVNSSRRTSFCSSRIAEIPIENIVHQSKVESLQWQLKETEKSREMYKAVMKQVVTFLEKTHRSLELLSNRINSSKKTVPRSKSEHQIVAEDASSCSSTLNGTEDFTMFRDFTWRRPKKEETPPEEVPPERLSQEAFRLLRTAQSLLNTQEPKLMNPESIDDAEFLAQLAKEFPPQTPEMKPPQRTTSFSMSPKLLTPERETRISTAFNRKLSLQFSETRKSVYTKLNNSRDSVLFRGSCMESEQQHHQQHAFLSSTAVNDLIKEQRRKSFCDKSVLGNNSCSNSNGSNRLVFKTSNNNESEKSNSPPAGSISSVEDESGFSSMNSFQDVGLPLITDEVTAKNVLLKSMLHNDQQFTNLPNENNHHDKITNNQQHDDVKLWQKPSDTTDIQHKRWSSTPANYTNPANSTKQTMNVLWV